MKKDFKDIDNIIYDSQIKKGDVYEVTKDVSFTQPPLYRILSKGTRLWVTDVTDFWPCMEKEVGDDYAIWGDFLNDFIADGTIIKIKNPEYPRAYYQAKGKFLKLMDEAKKEEAKFKKYEK